MDRFNVTGSFGWATVIEDSEGPYVLFAGHQQALAEKDREIAALKGDLEKHVAIALDLQEYRQKYQQLMEKAVLFATWLKQAMDNEADEAQDADTFIKSPEVQAWKEQQS